MKTKKDVEGIREYLLECLKYKLRAKTPDCEKQAAREFADHIRTLDLTRSKNPNTSQQ